MEEKRFKKGLPIIENPFPLTKSPLVQCLTNTVTVESMANAILYIDGKPVMADQPWELDDFLNQADALVLNLGGFSPESAQALLIAGRLAQEKQVPSVIDLVGVTASPLRLKTAFQLLDYKPTVIKGNISEMRTFCQLSSTGKGVDAGEDDQLEQAILELAQGMKEVAFAHPDTLFLATGPRDIIAYGDEVYFLKNGVAQLDRFTGTGDIVGAITATLLGAGHDVLTATILAVTYFNLCGERAASMTKGLADFRQACLNQLSLLMEDTNWIEGMKGGQVNGL